MKNKYNQTPKKTWSYPDSFKLKAVKLSQQDGIPVKDVAAMLEIHPGMLSKWRKDFRDGKIVDDGSVSLSEIKKEKKEFDRIATLEKENHRLKQENKLLKKYQRFLGERHKKNINLSRETED